jgi:hypothetical protein
MNYKKIYEALIERSIARTIDDETETHHIVPRCMGGSNEKNNLVELTPEEHYVAHQLLVKMYPSNHKLATAATMMIANRKSNKLYGWLRRRHSSAMRVLQKGEKNSQFGSRWVHNPATKESKKHRGDLEDGWVYGKYKVPKIPKITVDKREDTRKKQIDIYRKYYIIYREVGFNEFVKITGYDKSKANLVQRFANLLGDEFIPQNGKKR